MISAEQAFAERLNELDLSALSLDEQTFLRIMFGGAVMVTRDDVPVIQTLSGVSLGSLVDCEPATVDLLSEG